MVKKKIIYLAIFLALLPLMNALSCTDSFESTDEIIQVCGYCSNLNMTPCSDTQGCNFTIYYHDFTKFIENVTAVNEGDGIFYYNISQYDGTNKNLSDGNYFGELYCGERSRDDLSFSVSTRVTLGGSFSGSSITVLGDKVETIDENRIPADIEKLFDFFGEKLSPSNEKRGKYFLGLILILFIFSNEIFRTIKKVKVKKLW